MRSARPQYRAHSRRSSENRNRAYTHIAAPSPRDMRAVPYVANPSSGSASSSTHHRTATFPSFPSHILPVAGAPFQPSLPQQPLTGDMVPYPGIPPARHATIAPAGAALGHNRNDSVLASAEEYRHYTTNLTSFYANGNTGGSSHHQRKRRGNLPKDATKILRQWFDEHKEAPYPGEDMKTILCHQTGLQMSQVRNSPESKHMQIKTENLFLALSVGLQPFPSNSLVSIGQQLVYQCPKTTAPN
jgi:homeobox KN domain-containing protein